MNKVEEILRNKENYNCVTEEFLPQVIEAMKEFGKICFEAARKYHLHNTYEFDHYEEFLKEIEDDVQKEIQE